MWLAAGIRARCFAFGLVCCALLPAADAETGDRDAAERIAEHTKLLQQHGIGVDAAGLVAFLRNQLPSAEHDAEIARLVEQLGHAQFSVREEAAKRLKLMGEPARRALAKAKGSPDAEVVWRAEQLLGELDSGQQVDENRALLQATFVLLKERRSADAAEVLLAALPLCDEPYLVDAACEALWASVDRAQAAQFRAALRSESPAVVAAAIVALELALGEEETSEIDPFLESDDPRLQLAATRALIDRRPREVAQILVRLTQSEDADVAAQAEGLLVALSGEVLGEVDWLRWRDEQLAAAKLRMVAAARFDLSLGRLWLVESFAGGVGRFEYESGIGRALRVERGVAAIGGGDQPEGDQRLLVSAQRLTGRPELPAALEVRTRLGAEDNNNFGWHLGVSVGGVKLLFHPGVSGGAFRAETVDEHEYLFGNVNMGFTPGPDVMHDMSIFVRRTANGARFEVTILDGKNPKQRFAHAFDVAAEQLGKFDRVGLERSGRTGGAALFDEIEIRAK